MATSIVSADTNPTKVIIKEGGAKGDTGDPGVNGTGLNDIRYNLLSNPLLHLNFTPNNLASSISGAFSLTRASVKNYFNIYGVLTQAAANEPAIESDGILLEPAATNYTIYSDDFLNAAWDQNGACTVDGGLPGLDGANTAFRINDADAPSNSSGANNLRSPIFTPDGASTYTASVYVRVESGTADLRMRLVGGGMDATASVSGVGQDWIRLSVTDTCINTTATKVILYSSLGLAFVAQFQQIEINPSATSFIRTAAAPVTRDFDEIELTYDDNFPLPSDSWSVYSQIKYKDYLLFPRVLTTEEDIDFSNRIRIFFDDDTSVLRCDNGALSVSSGAGAKEADNFAVTFDAETNTLSVYLDGVLSGSSNAGVPSSYKANILSIGLRSSDNAQIYNGNLRDFRVYDFAMTLDEINYLSGA